MRAMLLSAGFGTRLRPITDSIPKCLVSIKGQPLLGIWFDRLNLAGIKHFLVNTHYLSEQVENYIEKSQYKSQVKIINESELLGTAGTIIENIDFFEGQDGMVIHTDNYCMADLSEFWIAHANRPIGCLMTMMTFRTSNPSSCGIVEINELGVVFNFHEKVAKPPGNLANGAVYILSSELIKMIQKVEFANSKDFSKEILPKLLGKIFTYETKKELIDIGTIKNYEKANNLI